MCPLVQSTIFQDEESGVEANSVEEMRKKMGPGRKGIRPNNYHFHRN